MKGYVTNQQISYSLYVDVSEHSGFSPPNHPLKHRVFHYFHHPFRGVTPIFGNTHMQYSSFSVKGHPIIQSSNHDPEANDNISRCLEMR